MYSKRVKPIFLTALLFAVIYPLVNIYLIFPGFSKLSIINAEKNAIQIGGFLAETIINDNSDFTDLHQVIRASSAFNLAKIKIFSNSGLTVYSTDPADITKQNDKPYFHEIVAKGKPYTKFVVKDGLTLEGAKVSRDLVETYVPIMDNANFQGAFEIYQDITERNTSLKLIASKFTMLSVFMMAGFLLVAIFILLKVDQEIVSPRDEHGLIRLQTPRALLLSMIVALFVTETIIMMVVSAWDISSPVVEILVDSFLLVILAAPMIYLFVNRPLLLLVAQYKKDQEKIKLHYKTEKILKQILHLSIESLSLQEILEEFIMLITSFPWLEVRAKGAVFLVVDNQETLELKAHHNLHDALVEKCAKVPFGTCLCGKAALTRELVFTDCLNDDHHIRYDGIAPHGHYCVPFFSSTKNLLGVFTLYTEAGALRKQASEDTLVAASHMLAGVVERKNLENRLEKYSITDELTSLLNRRGFMNLSERHLQIAQRGKNTSLLLFADMDNLKTINDVQGHHFGDQALIDIGNILKVTFRDSDIIGRLGGDEFAVLFTTHIELFHYPTVVDRIEESVAKFNEQEEREYKLSISIGVAEYNPAEPVTVKDLISLADERMYKAKQKKKELAK